MGMVEQAVKDAPSFPSTQEDRQKKLALVFDILQGVGRRGLDLSVQGPRLLACWTKMENGHLVPTF